MMDARGDKERRFAELLNPIRDIAVTWNIDIAADLEEYRKDLDHIIEENNEGSTKIDFTEAAMLVQGSANIYSRKVEYVYDISHKSMDSLIKKKHKAARLPSSIGPDGVDLDTVFDSDDVVLHGLDKAIVEKQNVDLADPDEFESYASLRQGQLRALPPLSLLSAESTNTATLSSKAPSTGYKLGNLAVHTSGALLLEERDRHVIDPTASTIARQAQFNALASANTSSGRPALHGVGSVSLGLPFGSPRLLFASRLHNATPMPGLSAILGSPSQRASTAIGLAALQGASFGSIPSISSGGPSVPTFSVSPTPLPQSLGNQPFSAISPVAPPTFAADGTLDQSHDRDDDDDDDAGGDDFQAYNPEDAESVSPESAFIPAASTAESIAPRRGELPSLPSATVGQSHLGARDDEDGDDDENDPYYMLDPHDASTAVSRPFKRGRAWVKPKPLVEDAFDVGSLTGDTDKVQRFADSLTTDPLEEVVHRGVSRGAIAAPSYHEFASQYIRMLVLRKSMKRASKRIAAARAVAPTTAASVVSRSHLDDVESRPIAVPVFNHHLVGDGDSDDDGALDASQVVHDLEAIALSSASAAEQRDQWREETGVMSAELQADEFAPLALDTELSQLSRSYEELCTEHMNSYLAQSDRYRAESQLSRRVQEWQARLEPILRDLESRRPFDIYDYGTEVLDTVERLGQLSVATDADNKGNEDDNQSERASMNGMDVDEPGKGIPSIEKGGVETTLYDTLLGKPAYEVCRTFLAALQLANSGNIDIVADPLDEPNEVRSGRGMNSSQRTKDVVAMKKDARHLDLPDARMVRVKLLKRERPDYSVSSFANDDVDTGFMSSTQSQSESSSGNSQGINEATSTTITAKGKQQRAKKTSSNSLSEKRRTNRSGGGKARNKRGYSISDDDDDDEEEEEEVNIVETSESEVDTDDLVESDVSENAHVNSEDDQKTIHGSDSGSGSNANKPLKNRAAKHPAPQSQKSRRSGRPHVKKMVYADVEESDGDVDGGVDGNVGRDGVVNGEWVEDQKRAKEEEKGKSGRSVSFQDRRSIVSVDESAPLPSLPSIVDVDMTEAGSTSKGNRAKSHKAPVGQREDTGRKRGKHGKSLSILDGDEDHKEVEMILHGSDNEHGAVVGGKRRAYDVESLRAEVEGEIPPTSSSETNVIRTGVIDLSLDEDDARKKALVRTRLDLTEEEVERRESDRKRDAEAKDLEMLQIAGLM